MAKINYAWMVTDPTHLSTMGDICWKQDMSSVADQIFGAVDRRWWRAVHVAFYTTKKEAQEDAAKRIEKLRNGR